MHSLFLVCLCSFKLNLQQQQSPLYFDISNNTGTAHTVNYMRETNRRGPVSMFEQKKIVQCSETLVLFSLWPTAKKKMKMKQGQQHY